MKNITTVTINAAWVKEFEDAAMRAAEKTIDATLTEVRAAQVMPFDTGDMQDADTYTDVRRVKDGVLSRIITDSDQARRLYYHPEYDFQTVHNPNAGAGWFAPWAEGGEHEAFVEDQFHKRMEKELKK